MTNPTALDNNPVNANFLSQFNFQFSMKRAPNVDYFVQAATLPGISLDPVNTDNPLVNIPQPGDHLYYEEFGMQFKVDEYLNNYLEIHNWLKALGYPNTNDEYAAIAANPEFTGLGLKSDCSLFISNNLKNYKIEVVFKDAFPISLSNLQFDITSTDVSFLDCFCALKYTSYDINRLS